MLPKPTQLIEERDIIRETVGYDVISKVDLIDLPAVMEFLNIVNNYNRMKRVEDKYKGYGISIKRNNRSTKRTNQNVRGNKQIKRSIN